MTPAQRLRAEQPSIRRIQWLINKMDDHGGAPLTRRLARQLVQIDMHIFYLSMIVRGRGVMEQSLWTAKDCERFVKVQFAAWARNVCGWCPYGSGMAAEYLTLSLPVEPLWIDQYTHGPYAPWHIDRFGAPKPMRAIWFNESRARNLQADSPDRWVRQATITRRPPYRQIERQLEQLLRRLQS